MSRLELCIPGEILCQVAAYSWTAGPLLGQQSPVIATRLALGGYYKDVFHRHYSTSTAWVDREFDGDYARAVTFLSEILADNFMQFYGSNEHILCTYNLDLMLACTEVNKHNAKKVIKYSLKYDAYECLLFAHQALGDKFREVFAKVINRGIVPRCSDKMYTFIKDVCKIPGRHIGSITSAYAAHKGESETLLVEMDKKRDNEFLRTAAADVRDIIRVADNPALLYMISEGLTKEEVIKQLRKAGARRMLTKYLKNVKDISWQTATSLDSSYDESEDILRLLITADHAHEFVTQMCARDTGIWDPIHMENTGNVTRLFRVIRSLLSAEDMARTLTWFVEQPALSTAQCIKYVSGLLPVHHMDNPHHHGLVSYLFANMKPAFVGNKNVMIYLLCVKYYSQHPRIVANTPRYAFQGAIFPCDNPIILAHNLQYNRKNGNIVIPNKYILTGLGPPKTTPEQCIMTYIADLEWWQRELSNFINPANVRNIGPPRGLIIPTDPRDAHPTPNESDEIAYPPPLRSAAHAAGVHF